MSDDSSTRPTARVVPKPRRVRFDMPAGTSRQHFVDGDLVMSHFVSTLSATFPEGEDFFIRSVREYRDHISDADLKEAVKGFIAQEATHDTSIGCSTIGFKQWAIPPRGSIGMSRSWLADLRSVFLPRCAWL